MSTPKSEVLNQVTIHQVALFCEDITATRTFYEELLGARFLAEFNPPGLLFFKFGETRLLLDQNGKPGLVYFRVEDIENKVALLKELGVQFESDVHAVFKDDEGLFGKAGDSEYMAFFKDPSENMLALVQQKTAEE